MNSYFERENRKLVPLKTLNPVAKEYDTVAWKTTQQNDWSLPQSKQPAMDVRPKQTERQISIALTQYADTQDQQHQETSQTLQPGAATAWENQTNSQHVKHLQSHQIPSGDVTIMYKQTEITAALVHQQRLLSLSA